MGIGIGSGAALWLASQLVGSAVLDDVTSHVTRDVTAHFTLPDGLAVSLWASTPQLFNPTDLDVDARGRVWVTEAVNYRRFNTAKEGRLHRPEGDRVVILEDSDGDGVCDSSKVFVQDADLTAPLGIAVLGPPEGPREVYVSCSPNVFKYVDENGDDVPERRETFLTGFGGHDHDHGVHALVEGPDGALYFNAGNAGPHVVTDGAGFTLRASSFTSGESGPPKFVSDDGHVWVGGVALRIGRDGRGLSVLAHNFRNCYEVAIDSFGDLWQNDNDDDGNQGCRIAWLMHGANQGYASADGRRSWEADRRPGQSILTAHWHQDDPGVLPLGANTGGGGPTGIALLESVELGEPFAGALFSCDAGRSTVWWCKPELCGAGFALEPKSFLAPRADDPERSWFRPSDVAVDLDGSLFIADWFDPVVGGHGMLDDHGGGRILRVTRRGAERGAAKKCIPDLRTSVGRRIALTSPAVHVRGAAFDSLLAHADEPETATTLRGLLMEGTENTDRAGSTKSTTSTNSTRSSLWCQARALYALAAMHQLEPNDLDPFVSSSDPRARILAWRLRQPLPIYGNVTNTVRGDLAWWQRFATDPSPAVRREVATSLRGRPFGESVLLIRELATRLDPADRFEVEALGLACEGSEVPIWNDLVALLGDTPTKWSPRFEAITWRLHPPAAIDGLYARAATAELPVAARRRAIDALAFIVDARAADAMVDLVLHGPNDLRPVAASWIERLDGGAWQGFGPANKLGIGSHDPATACWRSGVLKGGAKQLDVNVASARALWLVVEDGGDGFSCDWADWIEPTLEGPVRADGTRESLKLTDLSPLVATVGWGRLGIDRNCGGGELKVGGARAAFGFGAHARSEIGFLLPSGRFERFTARVAPDDGGTTQQSRSTSVEFLVFVNREDTCAGDATTDGKGNDGKAKAAAARAELLASATPAAARLQAALSLAADPDGGLVLIELASRGELPEELRLPVADAIFRNPALSVRALASEVFLRVDETGGTQPSVKDYLALPADAARGRELFFSDRTGCAKCHTLGDRGGDVGPALTVIGGKYDRTALLDAILHPSAAIAFGFEPWIVVTKGGEVLSGFLLADGDPLVLKDTDGKRRTLAAADVATRRRSKLSLMPDNIATGLTAQELVDVVEFLSAARQ